MDNRKKYFIVAGTIYAVGIIGLCVLKFFAGLFILVPGMAYTFYKLWRL